MCDIGIVLVLLLELISGLINAEPSIRTDPTDVQVVESHNTTLHCEFDGLEICDSVYSVGWEMNETLIAVNGQIVDDSADFDLSRYTAVGPSHSGDYDLIVVNTGGIENTSIYRCVTVMNGTVLTRSNNAGVFVKFPSNTNLTCYHNTSYIHETPGYELETLCTDRSDTKSSLTWTRQGQSNQGTQIYAHLPDIQDKWTLHENDHSIPIKCESTIDRTKHCEIKLSVETYGILITEVDQNTEELILNCRGVPSEQNPTYLWIVNTELLVESNSNFSLSDSGTKLTIKNANNYHGNIVHCVVYGDNIRDKYGYYVINRPPPTTTTKATTTQSPTTTTATTPTTTIITTTTTTTTETPTTTVVIINPTPEDSTSLLPVVIVLVIIIVLLVIALMCVVVLWKFRHLIPFKSKESEKSTGHDYVNSQILLELKSEQTASTTDIDEDAKNAYVDQPDKSHQLHYDSCNLLDESQKPRSPRHDEAYANSPLSHQKHRNPERNGTYEVVHIDDGVATGQAKQEHIYKGLEIPGNESVYTPLQYNSSPADTTVADIKKVPNFRSPKTKRADANIMKPSVPQKPDTRSPQLKRSDAKSNPSDTCENTAAANSNGAIAKPLVPNKKIRQKPAGLPKRLPNNPKDKIAENDLTSALNKDKVGGNAKQIAKALEKKDDTPKIQPNKLKQGGWKVM